MLNEMAVFVNVVIGISRFTVVGMRNVYTGVWGRVLGSRIDERKLAPSSLTVERRLHELISKTESSSSESGFLPGASTDRGSHWVGQPSRRSVPLSSSSFSPSLFFLRRRGGGLGKGESLVARFRIIFHILLEWSNLMVRYHSEAW